MSPIEIAERPSSTEKKLRVIYEDRGKCFPRPGPTPPPPGDILEQIATKESYEVKDLVVLETAAAVIAKLPKE